jgi:thiamine kinase-like enzyme
MCRVAADVEGADPAVNGLLREVRDRVPAWAGRRLAYFPLDGGITNRNYRIDVDGESYVLRLGGNATHVLGIDRQAEHAAGVMAARAGVGPEVVAFLQPEEYLITRFVAGRALTAADLRMPAMLRALAAVLRRVHGGPAIPGRFSPFHTVEAYARTAVEAGVPLPAEMARLLEQARRIEAVWDPAALCPCHNDLLAGNFVLAGQRLYLLDWEYAGMGDPYFDLGNLAANQEFGEAECTLLLDAYFGAATPARRARLALMRAMSDLREGMWGIVQQGISHLEFDFADYARRHLERAGAVLAEATLDEWVRLVQAETRHDDGA